MNGKKHFASALAGGSHRRPTDALTETRQRLKTETAGDSKVLQHFEFAVLLAVSNLGADAFPAEITRQLSKSLGRHVSLAQVFVTLERLEDKGFVSSRDSEPQPVQGGRRRRIFEMKASGAQAIRVTTAAFNRMTSSAKTEISNVATRQTLPSST